MNGGNINIYCNDCENDATFDPVDGHPRTFKFETMIAVLLEMGSMGQTTAQVQHYEGIEELIKALIANYEKGNLVCMECGSHNVDMKFDVDVRSERDQAMAVERIDFDDMIDLGGSETAPRVNQIQLGQESETDTEEFTVEIDLGG